MKTDHSNRHKVKVDGDNHCGYYVFAIGLIENLHHKFLELDAERHASFLEEFGSDLDELLVGFPFCRHRFQVGGERPVFLHDLRPT